jgi:hypothetical protein
MSQSRDRSSPSAEKGTKPSNQGLQRRATSLSSFGRRAAAECQDVERARNPPISGRLSVGLIQDLIAREHQGEYREGLASITGSRTDAEIGEWVEALVVRELGGKVRGGLFTFKSVGAVFGLELESGERVVLKLFHPGHDMGELASAQRCLELAIGRGFPAPSPLTQLFRADASIIGGFYSFAAGEVRDGHEPDVRRELARTLVRLGVVLRDAQTGGLPVAPTRANYLWPPPHRSFVRIRQDFVARWIDQIGQRAQSIVRAIPLPPLPAHLDWGVKNVRFQGDQINVVFDWDSLQAASEAEMVGWASVQFTAEWDFPARLTPTAEESALFIDDYQTARGRVFSSDERR